MPESGSETILTITRNGKTEAATYMDLTNTIGANPELFSVYENKKIIVEGVIDRVNKDADTFPDADLIAILTMQDGCQIWVTQQDPVSLHIILPGIRIRLLATVGAGEFDDHSIRLYSPRDLKVLSASESN